MTAEMTSGIGQYHSNEFSAKRRKPYKTITIEGIRSLVDNPQAVDKDQGPWAIFSTLPTRNFKEQEVNGKFHALWADLDNNPKPLSEIEKNLRSLGDFDFEIYTSKSATESCQKSRILIPLNQPLSGADWVLFQEILNDKLVDAGVEPDRASQRAGQLCYLPNRGAFYDSRNRRDGSYLDPGSNFEWDALLSEKKARLDKQFAILKASSKDAEARRASLTMGGGPDLIGAFNKAYEVQDILLAAGYAQRGNNFRHPQSESGSFSASVKDGRVHSLSTTDLLYSGGGGAHDAFSAFQVLFAGGARDSALKLAGAQWLSIGGVSWNKYYQHKHMQDKAATASPSDFEDVADTCASQAKTNSPVAFPAPFRGAMAAVVQAALVVSPKPQPNLCLLSTLVGMASGCSGNYRLPSGMRLNLYGAGIAATGNGKELPRGVASALCAAAGSKIIGKPASGAGLEDLLEDRTSGLIAIDEIAHFLAGMNAKNAPHYQIDLAGILLQLFSVSSGHFQTRVRVKTKEALPSRKIENPCISLLGFSTPEKLGEVLQIKNIEDGLLGRFLFASGDEKVDPRRIFEQLKLPEAVIVAAGTLKKAVSLIAFDEPLPGVGDWEITIQIEPDAEQNLAELMVKFEHDRRKSNSGFGKALLVRSAEKLERIAGVLAVWDCPVQPAITPEHVHWAEAFVKASNDSLMDFAGVHVCGGDVQRHGQKILTIVGRILGGEYSASAQKRHEIELLADGKCPFSLALRVSKLDKKDFESAIEHLVELSEIGVANIAGKHPAGRKVLVLQ